MMMDTMRMNQDYLGKGSRNIILDEEPNVDATRVSKLFKRFC
jgi:pantothenate synthetase